MERAENVQVFLNLLNVEKKKPPKTNKQKATLKSNKVFMTQ